MTPPIGTRNDTIAAIATPPGAGGIAILRLSGPDVPTVLRVLFTPGKKKRPDRNFSFLPRHMHYGQARDQDGRPLDTVLAVHMPAPHSATGEDVGEIHCHGGPGVAAVLLEAALRAGVRLAGPGEFTRRAVLNGRMDLTQAEAVAELISAPTREGVRLAAAKLEGGLARTIGELRASLDDLRMRLILSMDFPEDYEEDPDRGRFARTVGLARERAGALLETFERARLWREGALAVLVGRVNAGKSSLLNALIGRQRAIVSDEPGTTRDYLEESVNIKGVPLRLVDTAGLRDDGGAIETEGVRRARALAAEADLVLFVLDGACPPHSDDYAFIRRHEAMLGKGRLLLVLSKDDLVHASPRKEAAGGGAGRERLAQCAPAELAAPLRSCPCFAVSAHTGEGLGRLAEGMAAALTGPDASDGTLSQPGAPSRPVSGDIAPNLRQSELLRRADGELLALEKALAQGSPPDMLIQHLERINGLLDEVTGSTDNEELLDRVFASFCIGK
jgi:tRNA modification GTPase